jgi:hypothetical protein
MTVMGIADALLHCRCWLMCLRYGLQLASLLQRYGALRWKAAVLVGRGSALYAPCMRSLYCQHFTLQQMVRTDEEWEHQFMSS